MRDLKLYWKDIRTIAENLPEFVWLATVEPGGCIVEAAAAHAAPLLYTKSHRLAENAEIAAHHAEEKAVKLRLVNDSLRRQGIAIVPIQS